MVASIVLAPNFEVAFCVFTDWAFLRRFAAFMNVTTIPAFPFDRGISFEDLALRYVCQQFPIPPFMILLHFSDHTESSSYVFEALFLRHISEVGIEGSPTPVSPPLPPPSGFPMLTQ